MYQFVYWKKVVDTYDVGSIEESARNFSEFDIEIIRKNDFFVFINHPSKKERMVKIMKQFNIYKSTMKYLTDKNLSLNAKGFLSIVLFNDEIIGLDIQKYCTDNKETIKDALLELRINKYIKYDSESKKLIVAPVPYTEWDEYLR